ncbi:Ran-binding protein 9 [Pseudocercospora fuligena]|uniref:Ran-binding protein 9 n=1 Tax=Pseudocercospora fuligena TaxID=685502 RepID=A0A8H6RD93_9PEZI|nr:Ran-binding protein 9 [Pseudocercospora fuligena]
MSNRINDNGEFEWSFPGAPAQPRSSRAILGERGYRSYAEIVHGTDSRRPQRDSSWRDYLPSPPGGPAIHPSRDSLITAGMSREYDFDAANAGPRRMTWSFPGAPATPLPYPEDLEQPFFVPSYLRQSRHVERLRQEHERQMADLRELTLRHQASRQPVLSTSPSISSLNKNTTTHYHRAPVQDIIERLPPPSVEDERLHRLPSRWSEEDKMNGLEIMADGTEVRFNGITKTSDEAAAVRSNYPMPKEVGIYYFEVTILSRGKDGLIGIGFSSQKANLNRLPGWEGESWAYHGDDGYIFACTASGKAYGPRFASQDVIGCGVNFRTGNAFFTKNGNHLGQAFPGIKQGQLFPSVGMKKPGEHLRINFGKTPFVFDIDSMVEQEKQSILADIAKADVSNLHPPDDESALVNNLIGQYLAHEGYVETAKAFSRDVQERQQSLSDDSKSFAVSSDEDDVHALHRQRIRRAILDGDIDKAMKYQTSYYPTLFEDDRNRDIYFRLRCRKFIEMMRRHSDLQNSASSPTTVTKSVESLNSDGRADTAEDGEDAGEQPPDTQMELDDQLHRETSKSLEPPTGDDIDMDASQELSPKIQFMKADQLLSAAITYGQELQGEFSADLKRKKQFKEIFAVMAYANIKESPVAHLFDTQGRGQIAEEVNGAILVSLGKPSSAALEKLCAQTEVLLEETANRTGGATALVGVKADFLGP